MAGKCENGVFQQENGVWGYRFSILIDGRRISRKKLTDENGKPLKTQKQALKAREVAIKNAHLEMKRKQAVSRRTFKEVYEEYCENGRKDRKYQTIRKQDSLWENHLCEKFGKRFIDEISVAEVNDYLAELYYSNGYSYQYTESFLKMFYLIFGQAYSRNYLEVDAYNKLCVNKDTRIKMPKLKSEDDTDIVSFSRSELATMDKYFEGTNAETAYLLGRYCGLRINECYGLKWENIDLENGTICIDRQMQYQEGVVKLVAPKTRNSKRTIYLNDFMKAYFQKIADQKKEDEVRFAVHRQQNRKMIEDIDENMIYSTDLVNCLPEGKIQTVNSMKYHSREIKSRFGIDFKFHHLRHTYGTLMAEMNTPQHLLCDQMGHGHIHVTQRYYIAISQTGVEILRNNLNNL
nr:site-specific integrase [Oscillospiraceae bacterium]